MDVGSQAITYWGPTGTLDRYGKPALSAPVALIGRWEDRVQVVVNKSGEDVVSKSRVFLSGEASIDSDGWLFLGTTTEADPNKVDAQEILAVSRTPDLRNLDALVTVYTR